MVALDLAVTLPGGRVVVLDSAAQVVSDRIYDATVLEARVTSAGLLRRVHAPPAPARQPGTS